MRRRFRKMPIKKLRLGKMNKVLWHNKAATQEVLLFCVATFIKKY